MRLWNTMVWALADGAGSGAGGGGGADAGGGAGGGGGVGGAGGASSAGAGAAGGEAAPRGLDALRSEVAALDAGGAEGAKGPAKAPGVGHNGGPEWLPSDLPEDLRDATPEATLAKVWGARPKPPAKPADYTFTPSADFAKKHGDLAADPVLDVAREVLHKAGVPQGKFQEIVEGWYGELERRDLLQPKLDPEAELSQLMPKTGAERDRRIAALRRWQGAQNQIDALVSAKDLSPVEGNIMVALTVQAAGVQLVEKLLKWRGGTGVVAAPGSGAAGEYSWDQADRDMRDERYSTRSDKHDPKFRRDTDERMRALGPRRKTA